MNIMYIILTSGRRRRRRRETFGSRAGRTCAVRQTAAAWPAGVLAPPSPPPPDPATPHGTAGGAAPDSIDSRRRFRLRSAKI